MASIPQVFEPVKLAGVTLQNRIIRSATGEGLGDAQGRPKEELGKLYERIAKGGAGAIITGLCGVAPEGCAINNMNMIHTDDQIGAFKKIPPFAHKHNTPIFMQLAHAGRQTSKVLAGGKTVSPSAIRDRVFLNKPRALTESGIEGLIQGFAQAARRAKEAGFDGVQFHGAHGYLLSQFISPHMNHRKDQWGGTLENRGRILIRIFEESRRLVGDFPLMIKINGSETRKKGVRPHEAARLARLLEAAGCDAVEVSCGIAEDGFNTVRVPKAPAEAMVNFLDEFRHLPGPVKWGVQKIAPVFTAIPGPIANYNVADAATIKKQVKIPVIAVGGIRNRQDMENIIQEGSADFVAMARPFIIEPGIVEKFKTGRALESKCIDCGYCLMGVTTRPLHCYYGKVK